MTNADKPKTIADCMVRVLENEGASTILWGDCGLLDDCAHMAKEHGISNIFDMHPMDRWSRVLNALEKDKRFVKWRVIINIGRHQSRRAVRCFRLKSAMTEQDYIDLGIEQK